MADHDPISRPPRAAPQAGSSRDHAVPVPGGFELLWRRDDVPPTVVPEPPPSVVAEPDGRAGPTDPDAPVPRFVAEPTVVVRRVLGRLMGDATMAERLTSALVDADRSEDLVALLDAALTGVLDQRGPLGEARVLIEDGVPFADHRRRIARDLLRWSTPQRIVLALRHLAELGCADVAELVGWPEEDVRGLTALWRPLDIDPAADDPADRPLTHLDPPRPFRT